MKGIKVATRYAKSLIELARERNILDKVYDDIILVKQACKSSRDFTLMLQNPVIKTDKKLRILKSIFSGKLNEITQKFIEIITEKKREMYLPDITISFVSQYKEIRKIKTAEIITAAPLDEKLRNEVLAIIRNYTRTQVELEEKTDPSIIGGYILTVDNKQDDTSIKTKINKLQRTFKENLYVKDY